MQYCFSELKDKHRQLREDFSQNLSLRVHRSLSWLERYEKCDDLDGQFIFLWIAFNAAYANDIHDKTLFSEKEWQSGFITRLCEYDSHNQLNELIWNEFAGSIRVLLGNKYIYQPFWDYQNKLISDDDWKRRFENDNNYASRALGAGNTAAVLLVILSRLYTLRNQIIHGGSTWDSSVNRDQLKDGVNILSKLLPTFLNIMMDNPELVWGDANYPVIE